MKATVFSRMTRTFLQVSTFVHQYLFFLLNLNSYGLFLRSEVLLNRCAVTSFSCFVQCLKINTSGHDLCLVSYCCFECIRVFFHSHISSVNPIWSYFRKSTCLLFFFLLWRAKMNVKWPHDSSGTWCRQTCTSHNSSVVWACVQHQHIPCTASILTGLHAPKY